MLASVDQSECLVLLHFKRAGTGDFLGGVPSSLFVFYSFLLLNVCHTVMMTPCQMSAVLFLYVCVQASKEIIKLQIVLLL